MACSFRWNSLDHISRPRFNKTARICRVWRDVCQTSRVRKLPSVRIRCEMSSGESTAKSEVCRVFKHTDDPEGWDVAAFSGPVVIPPLQATKNTWRMYYYGRSGPTWAKGVQVLRNFPSGYVGMAVSTDGINWTRFEGSLTGGAVFGPAEGEEPFDSVFVAVSDAVPPQSSSERGPAESLSPSPWRLFYFAAGLDNTELPGLPGVKVTGWPWRPGMATSTDGFNFTRQGSPIIPLGGPGDWDRCMISAPRVLPPNHPGQAEGLRGKWYMTYHTLEESPEEGRPPTFFSIGVATSDDGRTWEKRGRVISRGQPGAWDDGGAGFRHVFMAADGTYVMLYEALNVKGQYAIGLATSKDGLTWEKATDVGPEPGGPVFSPSKEEGAWDNMVVGTPYVVPGPDGNFWLYYLGAGRDKDERGNVRGFGLAKSNGPDYKRWSRMRN